MKNNSESNVSGVQQSSYTPVLALEGQRVVLETDFFTDCDDVAALAALCGAAEGHPESFSLAGVSVNVSHPSIAAAIHTCLSFYGMGDVPVGMAPEPQPWNYDSKYVGGLAAMSADFHGEAIPALDLYRKVLADAPDGSVTIISIGFFNTLDAVLHDDPELFHRKVRAVVAMAGGFGPRASHCEYNVIGHLEATRNFVRDYKGEMLYVGFECGETVMTDLTGFPHGSGNFLLYAFEKRSNDNMRHPSWDPITVDFALRGENECYGLSPLGRVEVADDGRTVFTEDPAGNARHMVFNLPIEAVSDRISRVVRAGAHLQ